MATCQHSEKENCNCPEGLKVPSAWLSFLQDQRGPRLQGKKLTQQSLSFRTSDNLQSTPELNFKAKRVQNLISWDKEHIHEPVFTCKLTKTEIRDIINNPLKVDTHSPQKGQ